MSSKAAAEQGFLMFGIVGIFTILYNTKYRISIVKMDVDEKMERKRALKSKILAWLLSVTICMSLAAGISVKAESMEELSGKEQYAAETTGNVETEMTDNGICGEDQEGISEDQSGEDQPEQEAPLPESPKPMPHPDGWENAKNGKKRYYKNGKYAIGLTKINGKTYLFDNVGFLLKNSWGKVKGKKYRTDKNGVIL